MSDSSIYFHYSEICSCYFEFEYRAAMNLNSRYFNLFCFCTGNLLVCPYGKHIQRAHTLAYPRWRNGCGGLWVGLLIQLPIHSKYIMPKPSAKCNLNSPAAADREFGRGGTAKLTNADHTSAKCAIMSTIASPWQLFVCPPTELAVARKQCLAAA